jgi:hypothetical protein
MIFRHPQVVFAAGVLSTALLGACSTPSNHRKDLAREELLKTLWQCLVEIPIRGERGKQFVSPCSQMDISSLNGVPRKRLLDALGPAQYCTGPTQKGFPEKRDCPMDQNPQWSFYRLSDPTVIGGGPELVCEANKHDYCATVEWRRSQ